MSETMTWIHLDDVTPAAYGDGITLRRLWRHENGAKAQVGRRMPPFRLLSRRLSPLMPGPLTGVRFAEVHLHLDISMSFTVALLQEPDAVLIDPVSRMAIEAAFASGDVKNRVRSRLARRRRDP